jgi:hypothetical protein
MADIELVIKIPEEEYEMIINSEDCGLHTLTRAIAHGTILSKGHGRLIDADNISFSQFFDAGDYAQARRGIYEAQTIIEADKEG